MRSGMMTGWEMKNLRDKHKCAVMELDSQSTESSNPSLTVGELPTAAQLGDLQWNEAMLVEISLNKSASVAGWQSPMEECFEATRFTPLNDQEDPSALFDDQFDNVTPVDSPSNFNHDQQDVNDDSFDVDRYLAFAGSKGKDFQIRRYCASSIDSSTSANSVVSTDFMSDTSDSDGPSAQLPRFTQNMVSQDAVVNQVAQPASASASGNANMGLNKSGVDDQSNPWKDIEEAEEKQQRAKLSVSPLGFWKNVEDLQSLGHVSGNSFAGVDEYHHDSMISGLQSP